jgi:hypothetical protein
MCHCCKDSRRKMLELSCFGGTCSSMCPKVQCLVYSTTLVPSNPHLLRTAVSIPRPYSGSRMELPACRQLGILIRSRYQSHIRLAHEFRCRKHGVPSGSRPTFRISGPGLWIDCGQYWSTRPGEPRATGTDGPWQVAGQAGNSNQRHRATLYKKLLVFSRKIEESGFCISLELDV